MNFSVFQFRGWVAAAALSVGVWQAAAATPNGRPPGRSIEFSGVEDQNVTTNFHQPDKRADTLKQVEQDLRAPLDIFSLTRPADAMMMMPLPRSAPRAPAKPTQQQLLRNRPWILMTPEEMILGTLPDDTLKPAGNGAGESGQHSRSQDYYLRMAGRKAGAEGSLWRDTEPTGSESARQSAGMPARVRETERALLKAANPSLEEDAASAETVRSGFSDIFHIHGEKTAAEEQSSLQHRANMQEYRRVIGAPSELSAGGFSAPHGLESSPAAGPSWAGAGDWAAPRTGQADKLPSTYSLPPQVPSATPKPFDASSLWPANALGLEPHPAPSGPPRPTFIAPKRPFL